MGFMVVQATPEPEFIFRDNQFLYNKSLLVIQMIILFFIILACALAGNQKTMSYVRFVELIYISFKLVLITWSIVLIVGQGIGGLIYKYFDKYKYIHYITEIETVLKIIMLSGETFELNYADITMWHSNNRCWIKDKTARTYVFSNHLNNKNNVAWWKEDGKRYYAFAYVLELIEGKIKSAKQG